jgi:tetratricopeptide (TPR) repeat protein
MKPIRSMQALLVAAVGLTSGTVAYQASAQVCWSGDAEKTMSACPNVGPKDFNVTTHGKNPHITYKSAPQQIDLKKKDVQNKPGGPTEKMAASQRDVREATLKPRVRALLISEIQGLESLYGTTPRNSPDRPQIMRRLAETYVELESAAFRDKTEAEIKKNKTDADKAAKVLAASRQNAIKYYGMMKDQYPSYSKLDEVLYYLAYEYEQAQDIPNALKVYHELIQKAPSSKYIPSAYLAFGELFFGQAQGDASKFELAKQAYSEVIKYPPPDNKMYGYAHYKLAYVAWNQGDLDPNNYAKSLGHFRKAIEFGVQYANLPNSQQVALAARKDMIPVYALTGKPDKAFEFFQPLSGDKPNETPKTFKMLDDLGQNYLDTGHYAEAISLYQDLMKRDKGPKYCRYHAHISEATLAMKSGAKDKIKDVLDAQLGVYKEFKGGNYPAEEKLFCANQTAGLLSETAMAWHLEAVGSGGVRGTGDAKTMTLAAYLYKRVVDNFTSDEFAKFEFPRIVKDDWPTVYKIKYAMADLLYFQKKWSECGPAFDSVVQENPGAAEAAEAAFAAVLCYQNIYDEKHKGGAARKGAGMMPGDKAKKGAKPEPESAKFKQKDFDDQQKGMIQAFNRYVCYIKPSDTDKEGKNQLVEVKYARARVYFESQHWEEAAIGFRDVALSYPEHEAGIFAAQLYLESLNVLGTHMERPRCFKSMADDVPQFIKLYCTGDRAKVNDDQCKQLSSIQVDILRLAAEGMIKEADKGGPSALQTYQQGAELYMDIWKKYGEEPLKNKKQPTAERLDEVVYNACKAYQAAHLVAKAIGCRQILLNPDFHMDKTSLAQKAIYEIGGNYQAIAVYDQAAEWYERYAKEVKNGDKADVALSDAVVLRLGLGQDDKAIEDAKLFATNYGARKPAQNAQIAFAIAAHYVEDKNWEEARRRLTGAMGLIDKSASYDVRVQAHVMLGRVYVNLKNKNSADGEYKKAKDLWGDKAQVTKLIDELKDNPQKIGKALTAVGEAYFFFAEQMRAKTVDPIKFPEYKELGSETSKKKMEDMTQEEFQKEIETRKKESEKVKKHIDTKVAEWVKKKQAAIESVEGEYKKIFDLQPAPPPRWVIASASRAGTMWGGFVADFRRAPIPAWMKKDDELRGTYYQNLDAASEPIKQRAKGAFVECLNRSVKFQYFDEYSRACEEWLAKNYKAEYHLVDEFRGAPNLVGSGLNDKPYPLDINGQPRVDVSAAAAAEPAKKEEPAKEDKPAAKDAKPKATPAPKGKK